MTENHLVPTHNNDKNFALLAYVMYLASIFCGVTAIIGVIMAYVFRADAPEWLQTHYTYMINTFWKGLLFFVISSILCLILIGFVLLLITFIWWVVRILNGLKALKNNAPIKDPTTWGF